MAGRAHQQPHENEEAWRPRGHHSEKKGFNRTHATDLTKLLLERLGIAQRERYFFYGAALPNDGQSGANIASRSLDKLSQMSAPTLELR